MKISPAALALVLIAATASAQPPPRVRGVIQAVEGQTLIVTTQNEGTVRLTLTDMTGINGLEKRTMADIKDNTFVGATAVKDRKGRWQATEIHIFPESMRGAGEGHYAWDLPDSTMTNGAATGIVAKGRGGTLNVRHSGGGVEIDVTRRTDIVALTTGSRALLVPGAAIMALAAPPAAGGNATAVAIIAETNGVKPPM
ncbi:MAG TPA: hypothetical protein VN818_08415 [Gammaproteobacteria bacterium]|nr:hypothetical protein [Gammaproteobacteria bacterium]